MHISCDAYFIAVVEKAGYLPELIGDRSEAEWVYDFLVSRLDGVMSRCTKAQLDVCICAVLTISIANLYADFSGGFGNANRKRRHQSH